MSLELVAELWNHIKTGMPKVDRESTAEFIVSMLAENGIDAEEIREAFVGDIYIKNAMLSYFDQNDLGDWNEEEDFDEYTEDDSNDEW